MNADAELDKSIRAWAKKLKGLEVAKAKALLSTAKPEESTWGEKIPRLKLTYTFPGYQIILLCSDDHVMVASIVISLTDDDDD